MRAYATAILFLFDTSGSDTHCATTTTLPPHVHIHVLSDIFNVSMYVYSLVIINWLR